MNRLIKQLSLKIDGLTLNQRVMPIYLCSSRLTSNHERPLKSRKLKDQSIESNKSIDINLIRIDQLIVNVKRCDNLSSLLDIIEPKLKQLNSNQMEIIIEKIDSIFNSIRKRSRHPNFILNKEFLLTANQIPFRTFLQHAIESIDQFNFKTFLIITKFIHLISSRPDDEIFKFILKAIDSRIDQLDSDQLSQLLISLNNFTVKQTTDLFERPMRKVLKIVKNKILANEIESNDLLIRYFGIFIQNNDLEIINHLIKYFQSPYHQFTSYQAVTLLKKLFILLRQKPSDQSESILNKINWNPLINKYNTIISDGLRTDQDFRHACHFLNILHQNIEKPNPYFDINDQKILNDLMPILIKNQPDLELRTKICIYNLIVNYMRSEIIDEKLLKFYYFLLCTDQDLIKVEGIDSFVTFCVLKLDFIDYRTLGSHLLKNENQRKVFNEIEISSTIHFISDLILNDIIENQFLDYLEALSKRLDDKNLNKSVPLNRLRQLNLATVHLNLLSKIDEDLKSKINHRLIEISTKLWSEHRLIIKDYLGINSKLQKVSFLSNGLYLTDFFGIYDRSIQDLIDLKDFEDYFFQIDKIPLKDHQNL